MSKASEKYIIGLTGNIGTGKTAVRRMLERLGALTIDADGLSHRAMAKGAVGYEPVLLAFGTKVLGAEGEIDRVKLANAVFQDPPALERLEAIIHPLVRQAVQTLIQSASQPVVVIEAIKLLEGDLAKVCDSIWVTYSPAALQLERLTRTRKMGHEQALQRINAQGSQADKMAAANVILRNLGSYVDLWGQVTDAWRDTVPASARPISSPQQEAITGEFRVIEARPQDCALIAGLLNRLGTAGQRLTADDVMIQFAEKEFLLLELHGEVVGLASRTIENLVACTSDLHLGPGIDVESALRQLMLTIEGTSRDLQCEASLVFPTAKLAANGSLWRRLGYEHRQQEALPLQAWRDAAKETQPKEAVLFFRQLEPDPVGGPIRTGVVQALQRSLHGRHVADK